MACIAAAVLIMKGLPSQPPDLPRHAILAEQAGKAFDAGNYEEVIRLSQECLDGFEPAAVRMQKELEGVGGDLPKGIVNSSVRKKLLSHGPLNDAAACSFYMGQAYRKLRRFDEAQAAYKKAAMFTYARVWDPAAANPFFWSPADDAAYWLQKLSDSR
jgi:tetratricopeptide (TPR) repeat protein